MKMRLIKTLLIATCVLLPPTIFAHDFGPGVRKVVVPSYPPLAIHLGIEERIIASVSIDRKGKVSSVTFDRGDRNFHKILEEALSGWAFEKSSRAKRKAKIEFIFRLVPYDSVDVTGVILHVPLTVEILAKRVKAVDSRG